MLGVTINMIDTINLNWRSDNLTHSDVKSLLSSYPTYSYQERKYYEGQAIPWEGWTVNDDKLGLIHISHASSLETDEPWKISAERSLGKYLNNDNCRQLSRSDAEEALMSWAADVEEKFPCVDPSGRECRRVDFYYQRPVENSRLVLQALKGVFRGTSCYDSGLAIRNRTNWLSRMYDKGIESKKIEYIDVLRSEEQLRAGRGSLTKYVDCRSGVIDVTQVCEVMNSKYGDAEEELVIMDKTDFAKNGVSGMVLLALKEHPELVEDFSRSVCYRTQRKYKGALASMVMRELKVNLRVTPEIFERVA